jgi:hypothetical protein
LKSLPQRPANFARSGNPDPIGSMIDAIDAATKDDVPTGSVSQQPEDAQ